MGWVFYSFFTSLWNRNLCGHHFVFQLVIVPRQQTNIWLLEYENINVYKNEEKIWKLYHCGGRNKKKREKRNSTNNSKLVFNLGQVLAGFGLGGLLLWSRNEELVSYQVSFCLLVLPLQRPEGVCRSCLCPWQQVWVFFWEAHTPPSNRLFHSLIADCTKTPLRIHLFAWPQNSHLLHSRACIYLQFHPLLLLYPSFSRLTGIKLYFLKVGAKAIFYFHQNFSLFSHVKRNLLYI